MAFNTYQVVTYSNQVYLANCGAIVDGSKDCELTGVSLWNDYYIAYTLLIDFLNN